MTLTKPWQAIGLLLPPIATRLGSLAVPNTFESLPWTFLKWVLQKLLLHKRETYHSSLIYPSETAIFMALYPMSWLIWANWKLSTLDWTPFLECYHHGLSPYLKIPNDLLYSCELGILIPNFSSHAVLLTYLIFFFFFLI